MQSYKKKQYFCSQQTKTDHKSRDTKVLSHHLRPANSHSSGCRPALLCSHRPCSPPVDTQVSPAHAHRMGMSRLRHTARPPRYAARRGAPSLSAQRFLRLQPPLPCPVAHSRMPQAIRTRNQVHTYHTKAPLPTSLFRASVALGHHPQRV